VISLTRQRVLARSLSLWRERFRAHQAQGRAALAVLRRATLKALQGSWRRWRGLQHLRSHARGVAVVLMRAVNRRDARWGLGALRRNRVVQSAAVVIQTRVRGLLTRVRTRHLREYREHREAVAELAFKYHRQAMKR
jgi:hypothetical protein